MELFGLSQNFFVIHGRRSVFPGVAPHAAKSLSQNHKTLSQAQCFFALLTLLNIAMTPMHSFAHEARFACARKVKNPLLQSFINKARHTFIRRVASRLEAN